MLSFFSYDEVVDMIRRNEIRDAKTIIAFLWYDRFLRGEK